MKLFSKCAIAAATVLSLGATSAFAAPTLSSTACSFSDLTNVTVTACSGFWEGNLLKGGTGSAVDANVAAALGTLTTSNTYLEKVGDVKVLDQNPSANVNFSTMLYGYTVIGLHFGASAFTPTIPGGATAFYAFDAGTAGVDILTVASKYAAARSGAAIFETQTAPIPEPETYALMLAGLGALGIVARRRRAAA